jgi:FlaG/FlaF family flagellin (archaellin)
VILAAVIAAFVFGMAGNIQKTKVVAATASQQGATTIWVTYQGGQDAAVVTAISAQINGGTLTPISTAVGSTIQFLGTPDRDHVVATATFTDGSSQVILDTYV